MTSMTPATSMTPLTLTAPAVAAVPIVAAAPVAATALDRAPANSASVINLAAAASAASAAPGAADSGARAELARIAGAFAEPQWLLERRNRALEIYETAPAPDRVKHLWIYTDPKHFPPRWNGAKAEGPDSSAPSAEAANALNLAAAGRQDSHSPLTPLPGIPSAGTPSAAAETPAQSAAAIIENGRLQLLRLSPEASRIGLEILDLHAAAISHRELVESHLGAAIPASHGKYEALNAALWREGAFVLIPKGVVLEKPIHLLFRVNEGNSFNAQRLLVIAQERSQATVVVEFFSPEKSGIQANAALEVFAEAAANLNIINVGDWGEKTTAFVTQRHSADRDASLLAVHAALGGKITKADIGTRLAGPGASAKILGVTFAQHGQHFDQHTEHIHAAPYTTSNIDFKVVAKDQARSAYTGVIRIESQAAACEAYQENRNLLLTDGPRVDTIPELEILNDDVSCSHGAAIGPIDPEQLFFLQSRGIPRIEAARLIAAGFVEPTLAAIPEGLRDRIRGYVEQRLQELGA